MRWVANLIGIYWLIAWCNHDVIMAKEYLVHRHARRTCRAMARGR